MLTITKDNFEKEVLKSEVPVLIDFWAPWCGHCINLAPTLDEIDSEANGAYKVGKINIDEEPELAMEFGVMSIPTCAKFEGGELRKKCLGAFPKASLLAQLEL